MMSGCQKMGRFARCTWAQFPPGLSDPKIYLTHFPSLLDIKLCIHWTKRPKIYVPSSLRGIARNSESCQVFFSYFLCSIYFAYEHVPALCVHYMCSSSSSIYILIMFKTDREVIPWNILYINMKWSHIDNKMCHPRVHCLVINLKCGHTRNHLVPTP